MEHAFEAATSALLSIGTHSAPTASRAGASKEAITADSSQSNDSLLNATLGALIELDDALDSRQPSPMHPHAKQADTAVADDISD